MIRILPLAAILLLATGCPPAVIEVRTKEADDLLDQGRMSEALVAYEKVVRRLQDVPARDSKQEQQWAGIYSRLFVHKAAAYASQHTEILRQIPLLAPALADPAGGALLSSTMAHEIALLSGPAGPLERADALTSLADALKRKADQPDLRKSSLTNSSDLHTLLLLEAAASFEHAHLRSMPNGDRSRLKGIYESLAKTASALPDAESATKEFRMIWKKRAEDYLDRADGALKDPTPAVLPEEMSKFADFSLARHLQEGVDWADQGTRLKAQRGKPEDIERCFRVSLRHLVFARECVLTPTAEEDNVLSTASIVLKFWRDVTKGD